MDRTESQFAAFLLARIEWQLEKISDEQHRLAWRKALLREQATRLRLGASPSEIQLAGEEVGCLLATAAPSAGANPRRVVVDDVSVSPSPRISNQHLTMEGLAS